MEEGLVNFRGVGVLGHGCCRRPENVPTKHVPWGGSEDSVVPSERATAGKTQQSFPSVGQDRWQQMPFQNWVP